MARLKLILVLSSLLFLSGNLRAQEVHGLDYYNQETYRLYAEGEWDSVIIMGREAVRQNIDFYYLRMRMGIAAWNLNNYRLAALHFRKALDFNRADPIALTYLHGCYLNLGWVMPARDLERKHARQIPDSLKKARVSGIWAENGIRISSNYQLAGNNLWASVGIRLPVNSRVALWQAFSLLKQGDSKKKEGLPAALQYEYYMSPEFSPDPIVSVRSFGHAQWIVSDTEFLNYVVGISTVIRSRPADIRLSYSGNRMDGMLTHQAEIELTAFPNGNATLYPGVIYRMLFSPLYKTSSLTVLLGLSLGPRIALDMNITQGYNRYYQFFDGMYLYNQTDPMLRNVGVNFTFRLNQILMKLSYQFDVKRNEMLQETYRQHGLYITIFTNL